MNILRLIAIALPVMLLMACGGGGSSGGTAADPTTPPTTMMPGTGNPNPLAGLNNFMPTANSITIGDVEEIASSDSARLLSSDVYVAGNLSEELTMNCGTRTCNTSIPAIGSVGLASETSGVNDLSFASFVFVITPNSRITNSTTIDEVSYARGSLTGTVGNTITQTDSNIPIEFQTFAGWLDGSIFGTTRVQTGTSGSEQHRFISYTVGVPATDNPTTTGSQTSPATWEGAVVATIKADRTFILGDAEITVNFMDMNVDLVFDEWRGLDNQAISGMSAITYSDLALSSGSFTGSGNEQVQGRFYGNSHEEVGGFFNTETVTGAFGGTRQ